MEEILVTIGNPRGEIPILPFCKVVVEGSVQKTAKNLRKQIAENPTGYGYAEGTKFSPAELYWAAYHNSTDEKPFAASDNFWCKEAIRKEAQEAQQKIDAQRLKDFDDYLLRGSWDEIPTANPEDAKCPNCGCYGLYDGHCQACDADICPDCSGVLDENSQCDNCGYGLEFLGQGY